MPQGRWVPLHEDVKVPVVKNILYAAKIMYKSDKVIMPAAVFAQTSYFVFVNFFQAVLFLKVLLSLIEGNASFSYYVKILLAFVGLSMLNEVIVVGCDYLLNVSAKRVFKGLNNMIFKKASEVDVACYEDPVFYDSYKRATDILNSGFFLGYCLQFARVIANLLSLILIVGVVATIDKAYLIFLAPVSIVFVVEIIKSKLIYKKDLSMTSNNRIKAYAQRTVFLKDFSKDVRCSNIFGVMLRNYQRAVDDNVRIIKTYGKKLFFFSMTGSIFGELVPIVGTYALASYKFYNNAGADISGFSVVLSAINSVRTCAEDIARSFAELSNMALYFQNLRDFFEYEPKIISGGKQAGELESLEIKNVSFKYPHSEKYSLKNVNIKIEKGQTVALVGVNGAGKSTLVKLLLRFYDPTEGEILYNGVNIKEYDVLSLRSKIATVFQDYKTFALSVAENVMCRECDENDKIQAEQMLRRSGAWDKIATLEDGVDTVLTREFDDNGAGLSGGENQKLAVARMFAKNFELAILDEPSSALDPIAEYKMYENLIAATENKTVIYISHRLSSAVLSDKIFVLDGGTVSESGSHAELMARGGKYSRMFTLQASSYNREDGDSVG
ncbi:MAG: ABC transporter ATP-binding protein [Eubacteriales bacterium]|nr:ABC transporter ATP-binding protein [Eubacteriales bacterium]